MLYLEVDESDVKLFHVSDFSEQGTIESERYPLTGILFVFTIRC